MVFLFGSSCSGHFRIAELIIERRCMKISGPEAVGIHKDWQPTEVAKLAKGHCSGPGKAMRRGLENGVL